MYRMYVIILLQKSFTRQRLLTPQQYYGKNFNEIELA
jgi:hypothetical protein